MNQNTEMMIGKITVVAFVVIMMIFYALMGEFNTEKQDVSPTPNYSNVVENIQKERREYEANRIREVLKKYE